MPGLFSISGVASGLDTDAIIEKVLTLQRVPIGKLQAQQASLQTQMAAFQEANTRLQALKDAANALARLAAFQAKSVESSHPDVLSATAIISAVPGRYTVTVEQLALAHQLKTQAYADIDATRLGTGELKLRVGDGPLVTLTLDESNNTLAGLRDAINRAQAGISATIIQDGDSSYRLVLTSDRTGTDYALTVDTSGLTGGAAPVFSDLQTAQNARVVLGSGPGAITVERDSNTVRDLIAGVTLNLKSVSATPVTVTVTSDGDKMRSAVQNLVDQFNNAIDFINQQFAFDPETLQGGVLLGNQTLIAIQQDLMAQVNTAIAGLEQGKNVLSYVGITLGGDGKLSFDSSAFDTAFAEDPLAVGRLFAVAGESTHTDVTFLSANAQTKPSAAGYAVHITQVATQARVTAGVAQTAPLATSETLTINGETIVLEAGWDQAQVIDAINAVADKTGVRAEATDSNGEGTGNYLTLRATQYGSATTISVSSNVSNGGPMPAGNTTGIGLTLVTPDNPAGEAGTGTGALGQDVAGTIGGEPATGSGLLLTGNPNNENTAGLQIQVRAMVTGEKGVVKVTAGAAFSLYNLLDRLTDVTDGTVQTELDTLQAHVDDLQRAIEDKEAALARRETQLRAQFERLERAMAQFQTQSAMLTAQLQGLPTFGQNNK